MSRSIKFLAFLVVALAFATAGFQPAKAAAPSITINSQLSNGCNSGDVSLSVTYEVVDLAASYTVRTIVSIGSSIYMDEQFNMSGADFAGATVWHLYNDNTGGTQNTSFPLPSDVPVTATIYFEGSSASITFQCNGVSGRPIPAGFELRTITCTVTVFDAPNGNPVAGATIKNGQTWYINPEAVKVTGNAKYPLWTEIYVSGTTNGFIPTACVSGAPSNGK